MSNNIFLSTVASSTPGGGGVVNTTYTDLLNLIATNNLVAGTIYEFDYLLKFNLIGTAGEWTATNSEVIQVQAISTNELSNAAYSVTHNENLVYTVNNTNSFNVSTINSNGYVSCRYCYGFNDANFINYKVDFDFRNQYFIKYVTGTNLVGFTNVDNGTAGITYYSITNCVNSEICFCQNVEFANILNSTYLENNNTAYNYRSINLFFSDAIIQESTFFNLQCVFSTITNTKINNVVLEISNSTINLSFFKTSTILNVNNSTINQLDIDTSTINLFRSVTTNNSYIQNSTIQAFEQSIFNSSTFINCNLSEIRINCIESYMSSCNNKFIANVKNSQISNSNTIDYLKFTKVCEFLNCTIDYLTNNVTDNTNNNILMYNINTNVLICSFEYSNTINTVVNSFYIPNCLLSRTLTYSRTNLVGLGANYQAGTDGAQSNTAFNLNEGVILANGYNQLNGTVIAQPLTSIPAGALKGKTVTANSNNIIVQYFEFFIK